MRRVLQSSRRILDRVGIDIHDIDDLAWVSNTKGVHTIENAKRVLRELYTVRNLTRSQVADQLRDIGKRWSKGQF